VPYVSLSHPFVERLIGTLRREYLDRTLFWTTADLEAKLLEFQHYYNHYRVHTAREIADLYRVSKLKLIAHGEPGTATSLWHGVPPPLAVYRERGHRRLATTAYESQCSSCIWGCAMAVEMIIDQWKPDRRRYRTETFCYGPLSCSKYRPGPTRKVPGRSGMTYEEQDWVDQDATSHRGPDE